jgi:pimeloyl-ACP methyl ester carboxylesterase
MREVVLAPDQKLAWSPPADRYVEVGPVRTRYWDEGEGEGIPLVLIHGFGDSVETWSRVIGRLAEHHRVVALDVLGAGRTDKPKEPMPFPRLAHFVPFDPCGHAPQLERSEEFGSLVVDFLRKQAWDRRLSPV